MRKVFLTCPVHENCTAQINLLDKNPGNRAPLKAPKWVHDWVGEQGLYFSVDSLQHIDSPLVEDPRPDTTARLHDKVDVLSSDIRDQFHLLGTKLESAEAHLYWSTRDLRNLLAERLTLRWWQLRKKRAWRKKTLGLL